MILIIFLILEKVNIAKAQKDSHTHTCVTVLFPIYTLPSPKNNAYDTKIFENDPFAKLDQTGVGKLMDMAIKLGKPVNPKLHVGICGEHGGDPSSVEFCHKIGLDYVSCSPFRVPIARLAAAQAAIANK